MLVFFVLPLSYKHINLCLHCSIVQYAVLYIIDPLIGRYTPLAFGESTNNSVNRENMKYLPLVVSVQNPAVTESRLGRHCVTCTI